MNDKERLALRCLKTIIRPVARFSIKHSLTIKELLEAAKIAMLEIAEEELARGGEKVNVSRLSVLTGIHRRDVMRLTREGDKLEDSQNLISRILGQWEQDPRFVTASGAPRVLSVDGEDNEFKELVELISKDLNPGTVLFQLERTGLVERGPRGLKLLRKVQSLQDDIAAGYQLLASDVEELSLAVQENLEGSLETPHLHARTEYDNLFVKDIPEVRSWLLKEGTAFHERARTFLSKFDKDLNPSRKDPAGSRVVVGTFSRVIEEETTE